MSLRNTALGSLDMQVFLNVHVHFSISINILSYGVQSRLVGLPLLPAILLPSLGVFVCMSARCIHLCCLYFSLSFLLSSLGPLFLRLTLERHSLASPPKEPHVFGQPGGVTAWHGLRHGSWSLTFWMSRLFAPKLFFWPTPWL